MQYFAIVLFECSESEDYSPAKILMNMCFTYYHEGRYNQFLIICQSRLNKIYMKMKQLTFLAVNHIENICTHTYANNQYGIR